MIEARHLVKRYVGLTAVDDVSFVLRAGEVLGYLGPNGSGKTTTVQLVVGLLEPSSGHVYAHGLDIQDDLMTHRRRLGYVPEEPLLYPFLSGREYLELVGQLREMPEALLKRKSDALLELFGLADAADQAIASYSKGMKQKVLLIAALLHDPDLLVLDEPDSGLDVSATLVLGHLVRMLAEQGKAVLYSSHVMEHVEQVCTTAIVLRRGRIVANEPVPRLCGRIASGRLDEAFTQLALGVNPERTARDIVDVVAIRA